MGIVIHIFFEMRIPSVIKKYSVSSFNRTAVCASPPNQVVLTHLRSGIRVYVFLVVKIHLSMYVLFCQQIISIND